MKTLLFLIGAGFLSGCIATAPVSIAWRSNASQQYATTDARNKKVADNNTVNADRTTETQAALTTGEGSANTAEQNQSRGEDAK
jgi:predicted membrane metal-binding protein